MAKRIDQFDDAPGGVVETDVALFNRGTSTFKGTWASILNLLTGAVIIARINAVLGTTWQSGGGGGGAGVQNSLSPASTTLAPSVDAVNAGLAGKADSSHGHSGFAPTGGAAGQVLKKIDGTAYNYSWQDDATGTGGTAASQAEAEAGVENTKFMTSLRALQSIVANAKTAALTGWTIGANAAITAADTITQAFGKIQAQLNAKADLLAPVTEPAAFNITKAGHTNREVTYSGAAAANATFNFTGMAVGDSGVILQGAAGVVTLVSASGAGAPFVYAPGVTATPTTAGQHGAIAWTLIDATAGNQVVRIDYRSQAAAGGGSSNVKAYRSVGTFVAPLTGGDSPDLATINIEPLTANGDAFEVYTRWSTGNENTTEQQFSKIMLNGTALMEHSLDVNCQAGHFRTYVERVSDTTVRVTGIYHNEYSGASSTAPFRIITVSSLSAGASVAARCARVGAQTKTVNLLRLSAVVERA